MSLRAGVWTLAYQEDEAARPEALGSGVATDTSAPTLSPDGERVAFEVPGEGIRVCRLGGGEVCRWVKAEGGHAVRPAWNPTSGELVFVRYEATAAGEDADIFTTANGLREVHPLVHQTGNQDDPDLSPDGRFLAYSSALTIGLRRAGVQVVRQLWVMDLATGVPRLLLPGVHQDFQPDWSPDGRWLAFSSDRGGSLDIWVVAADGTRARQLTSGPGAKSWPAWAPDGRSLLFTRTYKGRQTLWQLASDGSDPRPLEPFGPGSDIETRDADWR